VATRDNDMGRARAEAASVEARAEAASKGAYEADNRVAT